MKRHEWESDEEFVVMATAIWPSDMARAAQGVDQMRDRARRRWEGFRHEKVRDYAITTLRLQGQMLEALEDLRSLDKGAKKNRGAAKKKAAKRRKAVKRGAK